MSVIKDFINKDNVPIKVIYNSLALAFFANIKCVNWALVYGLGFSEGIMPLLYFGSTLLLLIGIFSAKKRPRNTPPNVYLALYIVVFYFLSSYIAGHPKTPLPFVACLVIIPLILPIYIRISVRAFLLGLMVIPVFSIRYMDAIFIMTSDWGNSISMDVSYGYLVPVVANIVYMLYYWKDDTPVVKVVNILISMVNTLFLIQIFLHGSRGPLFCSIFVVFLYFFIPKEKNSLGVVIRGTKITIALIILLLFAFFLAPLMGGLENYLASKGISSYAVTKIVDLSATGDFSNGRDSLTEMTLGLILERPFFGWGFDRFDANTNMLYPHNFILQVLYDGGILFFSVLIIPVIRSTVHRLQTCTYDQFTLLVTLFFCSVPGALVSHDLYMVSILWLFFGTALSNGFEYSNK